MAVESKRNNRVYLELMAAKGYVDPTPDRVEGIFYIDKNSCFKKCIKEKQDQPEDHKVGVVRDQIFIYDRRSLYLFDHETMLRKLVVAISHKQLFESFIVLTIILNSFVLAVTDYSDR